MSIYINPELLLALKRREAIKRLGKRYILHPEYRQTDNPAHGFWRHSNPQAQSDYRKSMPLPEIPKAADAGDRIVFWAALVIALFMIFG